MTEPSDRDREQVASARAELGAAGRIVDALEPLAGDDRLRVLASAAVLSGVVPMETVRALLRSIGGAP